MTQTPDPTAPEVRLVPESRGPWDYTVEVHGVPVGYLLGSNRDGFDAYLFGEGMEHDLIVNTRPILTRTKALSMVLRANADGPRRGL